MDKRRSLYLMISHTDTSIGKIIRYFTDYDYNHVSLSLDETFSGWVSFARYAQNVPLAGGFIAENADRLLAGDGAVPVRIFRLEISESRYRILKKMFAEAGNTGCGLIYNSFGALATSVGLDFPVTGAYTCLEFANAVLEESHATIRQLNDRLMPCLIYEGDLRNLIAPSGSRETDYFRKRTFCGALQETALHFVRLLRNTVQPNRPDLLSSIR